MGLFANILEKLGLKKKEEEAKAGAANASLGSKPNTPKPTHQNQMDSRPNPNAAKPNAGVPPLFVSPAFTPKPVAMSEVDVVSKLDALAKSNPQKLDWKVSIVDLLKLLDLDSDLAARKELAAELKCPADKIGGDYSEMNVWLHKEVLKRIAANGGNIPASLLN